MEIGVFRTTEYLLNFQLTLDDVIWLKALVQKPNHPNENEADCNRRQCLFNALSAIKLNKE